MSPIPLGILASAGGSGPAMDLLATATGGLGDTFGFYNLGAYNGVYQHFQLRMQLRSNYNQLDGTFTNRLRFNGNTAGNCTSRWIANITYENESGLGNRDFITAGQSRAFFNEEPTPAAFIVDILDPFETKYKTINVLSGFMDNQVSLTQRRVQVGTGHWRNTSPLSYLTIQNSLQWSYVNSRASLYGIKAQ